MHLSREGFTMHAFARMRRRRGATIAASITAVLATALTTVVTVLPASTAQAVTPVAGPIDPNTGYPFWYADSSGQKYEMCLDRPGTPPGLCLAAPQNPTARPWVDADPARSNLAADPETFWYDAEAEIQTGTQRLRFIAAQEAAFGGADAAARAGDQIAFGRIRVRLTGMVPGATYTVTQPYGTHTYTADDGGHVFVTQDIGCLDLPCDFTKPNASPVTTHLRWDPAVGPAAPAGYVGDPAVPHRVVGAPSGNNFFRVVGPNAGGPGVNSVQTNLFNVQGKLWNATQPMLGVVSTHNEVDFGAVPLGSTAPVPAQTVTLTNAGGGQTPLRLQTLGVSGANSTSFTLSNDTCSGKALAPGATCTVGVSYAPGALAGPVTAQLNVPSANGKDSVGGQRIMIRARVSDGTGKDARVTGPIDPVNGFPQWYQDENGTRVALCDDQNDPLCVLPTAPEGTYNPARPISFPTNFPGELFWWNADSTLDTTNSVSNRAVSARLVLAEEATFVTGDAVPGDQIAFGRIRIRVGGLQVGGTYTVTTPYGTYTLVAEDDGTGVGRINTTEDIGCQEVPCDFNRVNQSNIGPFLRQVGAPVGYLGNPNVQAPVTGGPNGNVFAISGPGVNSQTNLFAVSGKLAPGSGGGTGGTSSLTASATSAVVTAAQPASVTLTNTGTAAANPQVSLPAGSGFTATSDCPVALAPSASCVVTVGLDPRAPAQPGQTSTMQVSDGATPVLTVALKARGPVGASKLTASPTSAVVTAAQPASVTLTNTGTAAGAPRVSLPAGSGFRIVSNSCGTSLAASASCTVTVGLATNARPGQTSTLQVSDGTTPVTTVALTAGGAVGGSSKLTASKTTVPVNRKPASVKVTNTGTAPAAPQMSVPANGGFSIAKSTCAAALAPGKWCTVWVGPDAENPAQPGRTSVLRVSDGNTTQVLTVTLRRVGHVKKK
jgi:hypothetical protein